jgi:hypothetical protein
MAINETGKHCSSCNKTVIDFSLYTDKELVEFFKTVKGSVCGHMPKYQLNRPLLVTETGRSSFFKKLFLGTAIAGWLGLSDKADAQVTTTPAQTDQMAVVGKVKLTEEKQDTLKGYISLTLFDSQSKQPLRYASVTIQAGSYIFYSQGDEKGRVKLTILSGMIGSKAVLSISTSNYIYKATEFVIANKPMTKKLYVEEEERQMLDGEIMIAPPKDTAVKR